MNEVLQRVYQIGIIPVIAIDDADKAVPLARALVKGGLPAAEVTFRTAAGWAPAPSSPPSRPTGPSPPGPSLSSAPASTPLSPAMSLTRASP